MADTTLRSRVVVGQLGAAALLTELQPPDQPQQVTHVVVGGAVLRRRPELLQALAVELQPALMAIHAARPELELTPAELGVRMRVVDGSWLAAALRQRRCSARRVPAAPHNVPQLLEEAARLCQTPVLSTQPTTITTTVRMDVESSRLRGSCARGFQATYAERAVELVLWGLYDTGRCAARGNSGLDIAVRELMRFEEALAGPRDGDDGGAGSWWRGEVWYSLVWRRHLVEETLCAEEVGEMRQAGKEAGVLDRMRAMVAMGRCDEQMDRYDHLWAVWVTGAGRRRRVDVVLVPYDSSWPYAVAGWTGSRQYLRFMRQHALNCGWGAEVGLLAERLMLADGMFTNAHGTLRSVVRPQRKHPSAAGLGSAGSAVAGGVGVGVGVVPTEALPTDSAGVEFEPPGWRERGEAEQREVAAQEAREADYDRPAPLATVRSSLT
eukprot:XP_001689886.1 predicted protein [Chlamydomonas reinhardtii]